MPKFSIIIPCYNCERYVGEALRSCLDQEESDLEVVLVDDGSTDASLERAEQTIGADKRVKVVCQENRGVGAARNAGLREASGLYLNFLDADDLLEPQKLSLQGRALDGDPEIGLSLCDGVCVDAEGGLARGEFLRLRRYWGGRPLLDMFFAYGGQFPPLVPLVRRSLVDATGGFDEDRALSGWADSEFWMRLSLLRPRYHVLDERLCRYRSHGGNMTCDTEGMETAAWLAYEKTMARDPAACASALRSGHRVARELETANDHLRRLVARNEERRLSAEAGLSVERAKRLEASFALATSRERGRPLYLWGAGSGGERVARLLGRRSVPVAGFVDSDPRKAGERVAGVGVVEPAALPTDAFVLVASVHSEAIEADLSRRGRTEWKDFASVDFAALAVLETEELPR